MHLFSKKNTNTRKQSSKNKTAFPLASHDSSALNVTAIPHEAATSDCSFESKVAETMMSKVDHASATHGNESYTKMLEDPKLLDVKLPWSQVVSGESTGNLLSETTVAIAAVTEDAASSDVVAIAAEQKLEKLRQDREDAGVNEDEDVEVFEKCKCVHALVQL